ncbi:MAG: BrnT family toxin [Candidatus Poribacteria bacterium]|nr:BrnT family toxin [Candidatus Poribacteria bacterium]
MLFHWDRGKYQENIRKHSLSFEVASEVFKDPFRTDTPDEREDYGEDRWITTGHVGSRLITVVYVERSRAFRLISAWNATKEERREYEYANRPRT